MQIICEFDNCRRFAIYGEFYDKPFRCKKHKDNYTLASKLCQGINCKKKSIFNYENETKPLYCYEHKLNDMIDIINKKCKSIICFGTRGNPKYKGYCCHCYTLLFPCDPITFQILSKQKKSTYLDFVYAKTFNTTNY